MRASKSIFSEKEKTAASSMSLSFFDYFISVTFIRIDKILAESRQVIQCCDFSCRVPSNLIDTRQLYSRSTTFLNRFR